jgi:hypothetical protein
MFETFKYNRTIQFLNVSWNVMQDISNVKKDCLSEEEDMAITDFCKFIKCNRALKLVDISHC